MNRYMIICRLRWPALLLLTGIIALMDQAHILSWGRAWPLVPDFAGCSGFGRAGLRWRNSHRRLPLMDYAYGAGYPSGYAAQPGPYGAPGAPVPPVAPSTSIVPVQDDLAIRANKPFTGNAGTEEEGR